jgi:hypothetical protein
MTGIQYLNLPAIFGAVQDLKSGQQKSRLLELQSQMEQQKYASEQDARAKRQAYIASLPQEQQALAGLDPEGFVKGRVKAMFPDPVDGIVPEGAAVLRNGKVVYERPKIDGVTWGDTPAAQPPGANLKNAAPPSQTTPNYAQNIQAGENTTGNTAARNPRSTAMGDHQFLDETWLDMVLKHKPWLAEGKTTAEVLQMREIPELSAEMATSYAADNAKVLQGAGFEATPTNLGIAHRFGPTGAVRILTAEKANPNAPLSSVLPEEVLAANPHLRTMTIAQGRAQIDGHMKEATPPQSAETGDHEIRYDKGKPTEYPGKPGYVVARDRRTGAIVAVPAPAAGQTQADIDKAARDKAEAVRTMTADEVEKAGLPTGTVAQIDGRGKITVVKAVDAAAAKPNNDQTLAHGFANRMAATVATINQLERNGWAGPSFLERNVADLPGGNFVASSEYQQYERAKRDFINAVLRKESGAAIGKDEYASTDKQYFPQPGDDAAALADKKRARDLAVTNMREASGPFNKPSADAGDFGKMTQDQLLSVDPASLGADQKAAYLAALRAVK